MSRRRGSRRFHIWMHSEDDLPLAFLASFGQKSRRTKRKSTPRKTTRRVKAPQEVPTPPPTEVINLDDTAEAANISQSVNTKMGDFLQSGNFISSDEEETEMIKTKTNKKSSPHQFFISSDDSDDDCIFTKEEKSTVSIASEPGTSAGPSRDSSKDNKPKVLEDDIMEFVDSVLDKADSSKNENKRDTLNDIKSLEDFRKETEEMLKSASTLLDEIKTGRKAEPEPKVEESPTKVTIGSCPICLESLAGRPASVTVCGHIFCKECIMHTAQRLKKCPTCRKGINSKKIHPIYF